MSAKVHLHLRVSNLPKSREFYSQFFGSSPVKEKPGYVKFLPDWAPVNLALSDGTTGRDGVIDHVGVQVEAPQAVVAQLARVKAAGLAVREEMGVNCCHANQDKFWVEDPDGVEWEVYYLNYDLEGWEARPPEGETHEPARQKAALPMAAAACCGPSSSGCSS